MKIINLNTDDKKISGRLMRTMIQTAGILTARVFRAATDYRWIIRADEGTELYTGSVQNVEEGQAKCDQAVTDYVEVFDAHVRKLLDDLKAMAKESGIDFEIFLRQSIQYANEQRLDGLGIKPLKDDES